MKRKFAVILALLFLLNVMLLGCQTASSPDKETTAAGEDTTQKSAMLGAREKQVIVSVDWSDKKFDNDIEIKVYVDGELDSSKTTVVDSSVTHKDFTFSGSGKKNVKIKLNNEFVFTYEVDFDNKTYQEQKS